MQPMLNYCVVVKHIFVFLTTAAVVRGQVDKEIITNKDKTFVVGFPAHTSGSAIPLGSISLYLTSDEEAFALVTIPSIKGADKFVRLRPGGTMRLDLPVSLRMPSKTDVGIKKGININSNSTISVYGVSMEQGSTDGFLALPLQFLLLGNQYMIVTKTPTRNMHSFVMVTAKHDNTVITLHLKLSGPGMVDVNGLKYKNGESFSVTLQELDSFQLLADYNAGSLTGSTITSSKVISVYSGNDCAVKSFNQSACGFMVEQIPPIASWGNVFMLKSSTYRGIGDEFYILAAQNNTEITIELKVQQKHTINEGGFYRFVPLPGESTIIRSGSKTTLVVQFGQPKGVDNSKFSQFMSLVPSNDQLSNDFTIITPTGLGNAICFANLFVATRQRAQIVSKPAIKMSWKQIPFSTYSSTTVNLTSGSHRIYHRSPVKFFSTIFLCVSDYGTYGFPGGIRLFRPTRPCKKPKMIPGDRRDNDCDGKADEEIFNGIDDDGDSRIDEDLATPIPELQTRDVNQEECYRPEYRSVKSPPTYKAYGMCAVRGDIKITHIDYSVSSNNCYDTKNRTWKLIDGCLNNITRSHMVNTLRKSDYIDVRFPGPLTVSCHRDGLGNGFKSGKPYILSDCHGNASILHSDSGWENLNKCDYRNEVTVNRTWTVSNGCAKKTGYQIITLRLQGSPPAVQVKDDPIVSATGKNITLACRVREGDPTPTVTWYTPDGQAINKTNSIHDIEILDDLTERYRSKSVLKDNSLLITETRVRDSGLYRCVASNALGQSSRSVNVTIHDDLVDVDATVTIKGLKFDPLMNKPILDGEEDEDIIILKRNIKLQLTKVFVNMTGFQEVKILGFRNGSVKVLFRVVIKKQNKDENPQVVVSKVGQRLAVKVKSGNLGNYKVVPEMELREKPPPPKKLQANEIDESTVHISWVPPDFLSMYAVSGFALQYKVFGKDHWTIYDTVKGDNYRIEGLKPGTGYQIRTKSQNKYGYSIPSGSLEITTLDKGLSGAEISLIIIIPIALILASIVVWYIVKKRREENKHLHEKQPNADISLVKGVRYTSQKEVVYINENHKWTDIKREALELGRVLGEGEFGLVVEGKLTLEDNSVTRCAVKKLKNTATESDMKDLLNELDIMEQVGNHPNIVNLIGACAYDGPILVVVEFCANGSLLHYLQKQSSKTYEGMSEYQVHISPRERFKIAADVANGMSHLAKRRCVHRDLAARNVLLDDTWTAKVSDFGLSRDVYTDNVYEKTTGGKLPAKWMSIEALEAGLNTTQSDVWSFGVLLWEIETGGCIPYPAFSAMEMLSAVKQGYRLEKPASCSIQLYNIMLSCWEADPSRRPSFDELYASLQQLSDSTTGAIGYEYMSSSDDVRETYA